MTSRDVTPLESVEKQWRVFKEYHDKSISNLENSSGNSRNKKGQIYTTAESSSKHIKRDSWGPFGWFGGMTSWDDFERKQASMLKWSELTDTLSLIGKLLFDFNSSIVKIGWGNFYQGRT